MYSPDHISSNDIVFLGDSLTELFNFDEYFPGKPVKNRGISGDTAPQVIYRLEEILKSSPATLFLMIGINDIFNGYDNATINRNQEKIIKAFKERCQGTKIYVQSLLPVNESVLLIDENINPIIFEINDNLRASCKKLGVSYIDLHVDFLNDHGQMDEAYTYDGAHLTKKGYELWADLIRKYL